MSEQIDQLETVAARLDEAYAITELMASNFGSSRPDKAFAIMEDLINVVSDILRTQKNFLSETIEALNMLSHLNAPQGSM